jgi:hypothetical protein
MLQKQYIKFRRRFLLWVMETQIYEYLMTDVVWKIRFTMYYTQFSGRKYHKLYRDLLPGDIVLSTDGLKLTAKLIPGMWSHAGVCVSKNQVFEIAEMVHTGYRKSTFSDFCYESTRVCVLRPQGFGVHYTKRFIDNVLGFEGAPYDLEFELGVKALYCSEIIYLSDTERRLGCDLEDIAGLGRPYISPTGLYHSNVDVVGDSDAIL